MTKKRPRRNLSLQREKNLQIQNPKMIEEVEVESSNPFQTLNHEEQEEPQEVQNQIPDQQLEHLHHQQQDEEQQEPPHEEQQQHEQEEEEDDEEEEEEQEPEGMILSSHETITPDLIPESPPHTAPNIARKAVNRKKQVPHKKRVAIEKKLSILKENLKPIPFVPGKTLDFTKHENLLKRLGLWDFVHLEFDRDIRIDLLAALIVNFNPNLRCSSVNSFRIKVSRADLARALKLPVRKDKISINPPEALDLDPDVLSEEEISFIGDFVSNWVLLHEDTWMLPEDILSWTRLIKEGQPQKVDWAGLIWFMVEKELKAPQLQDCYYASHLQWLIKFQREDLFKEEENMAEVSMTEEEEAFDVKIHGLEDFQVQDLEKQQTELTLGQDNFVGEQVRDDEVMEFQEGREEEEEETERWLLDGKNRVDEHCLQRCNRNDVGGLECQPETKELEEERYGLSSKFTNLESFPSTDLIQEMGTTKLPYSSPVQLFDNSPGELLSSKVDNHINLGGLSMFGNGCKREINHEDDVFQHSLNGHHKRMRTDGPWDHKSLDFNLCMEQVQSWVDKARMLYEEKEQSFNEFQLGQQVLNGELQQHANVIEVLQKTKFEELHKRDLEIYRLEHELYAMSNLLDGYRKALKDSRRAFTEYREHHQLPDEPLYKDVGGPGGDVLSTVELEKRRLEREEEYRIKRLMIEEVIRNFEVGWFDKLKGYTNTVSFLDYKLLDLERAVKLLKETFTKKIPETSTCAVNEL